MTAPASGPMTERQLAVMERIDRRLPIKMIAKDLGLSETRVNQHIRALKDILGAESLNELVEAYRASLEQADLETPKEPAFEEPEELGEPDELEEPEKLEEVQTLDAPIADASFFSDQVPSKSTVFPFRLAVLVLLAMVAVVTALIVFKESPALGGDAHDRPMASDN